MKAGLPLAGSLNPKKTSDIIIYNINKYMLMLQCYLHPPSWYFFLWPCRNNFRDIELKFFCFITSILLLV